MPRHVRDLRPANLDAGEHSYESILESVRRGKLRFARIRTASGRLHFLIGVSPEQLDAIGELADRLSVGLILYGSRVSGPRLRQQQLDPLLKKSLPLFETKRRASATYPAVDGLRIEKTKIKEHGLDDPRTSDLSILLVDAARPQARLDRVAVVMEKRLRRLGCSFPIRIFSRVEGKRFREENDFTALGVDYLLGNLELADAAARGRIEHALQELYAVVNIGRSPFVWGDVRNGLVSAALLSASFHLTMGLHPVVPVTGFAFGFLGRYFARFRTWVTQEPCGSVLTNTMALAADAAIGMLVMAAVINPLGGFGISLKTIVAASLLHTLSKGSVRLFLDKTFSQGALPKQGLGVMVTISINFIQGLLTACVYAGNSAAALLQAAIALAGLTLVYLDSLRHRMILWTPR